MLNNQQNNAKVALTPKQAREQLMSEIDTVISMSNNSTTLNKTLQQLMFVYLRSADATICRKDNQQIADDIFHLSEISAAIERYQKSNINLN